MKPKILADLRHFEILTKKTCEIKNFKGKTLVSNLVISSLSHSDSSYKNYFIMSAPRISKFRRIWHKSPRLAVAYLRRKATRHAKRILIPKDEWNINWLGEEMRPYNSLHG